MVSGVIAAVSHAARRACNRRRPEDVSVGNHPDPPKEPAISTSTARRLPTGPLVAGLGGVVMGAVLGASLHFATGTTQPGSLIPAGAMEALATIGLVAALFVVGAVLLVPRSTRALGGLTLLLATGLVVGLIAGFALGPTGHPAPVVTGGIAQEPRVSTARLQGYVTLGGAVTAKELRR